MSISSIGTNDSLNSILSSSSPSQTTSLDASATAASSGTDQTSTNTTASAGNNSSLSNAITQALAQLNGSTDLSSLLTPDSQQSSSDFMSSLLASLPGLPESGTSSSTDLLSSLYGSSSGQASAPVTLNQSSSTIKLQTAIQNLITQLDNNSGTSSPFGGSSDSNPLPGLGNLQQSFNNLITTSGGDPSQASLQSFLKTIAANIQASTSIGTLLDTSA